MTTEALLTRTSLVKPPKRSARAELFRSAALITLAALGGCRGSRDASRPSDTEGVKSSTVADAQPREAQDRRGVEPSERGGDPTEAAELAEVRRFIELVESSDPARDMGIEHAYMGEVLTRLGAAIGAVSAAHGVDATREVTRIDEAARHVRVDPRALTHADHVRDAFRAATGILALVSARTDTDGEIWRLREAVQALDPDRPLLEQRGEVAEILQRTRRAFEAVSSAPDEAEGAG